MRSKMGFAMYDTADDYFSVDAFPSPSLILGFHLPIEWKAFVCGLSAALILNWILDQWGARFGIGGTEDQDYKDIDWDLLQKLTSQNRNLLDQLTSRTITLSSNIDHLEEIYYGRWSPGCHDDCTPTGYSGAEYDSDSSYDAFNNLASKRKRQRPSQYHALPPSDCRQCRPTRPCKDNVGTRLDVRVHSGESTDPTSSSGSEESHSAGGGPCSGSSSSTDSISFPSVSSLSCLSSPSVSSLSCLSSSGSSLPPVACSGEPLCANKRKSPDGRSALNYPLSPEVEAEGRSLELLCRRGHVRALWRCAIRMVRIIVTLLPDRLKRDLQRIPALVFAGEGEACCRRMVSDNVAGPDQYKTTFESRRAFFERIGLPFRNQPDRSDGKLSITRTARKPLVVMGTDTPLDVLKETQLEMEVKSKSQEIKLSGPQESVEAASLPTKSPVRKPIEPGMCIPVPRAKKILFLEKEAVGPIEMNLRRKHLEHLLGASTVFNKDTLNSPTETPLPQEVTASPKVELECHGSETPWISKETRAKLEFHIKRKKVQRLLGFRQSNKASVGNEKRRKAHPKRTKDSVKASEQPEGAVQDPGRNLAQKRRGPGAEVEPPSGASSVVSVEAKEPQTSEASETTGQPEVSVEQANQNNSQCTTDPSTTTNEKTLRGCPKVTYWPISLKGFRLRIFNTESTSKDI